MKISRTRLLRDAGSWGFLAPHLLLFLLFSVLPLFINTVISMFNWSLLGKKLFIGFGNFIRIIEDSRFWIALQNSVIFSLISIPAVIIVGLLFANLLNQKFYGKLWVLICVVAPTFFGSIGVLTTWKWIFASHPTGIANYYLNKFGLAHGAIAWFENPTRAWGVIIFVTVWWIVGFSVLLYLGALRRIPPEQYEAAKIDGAGPLRRFWSITMPWIRNVLFFDIVRQILMAFGLFDQVYIFTQGGPAGTTRTLVYYLFATGINRQALGRSAAISWFIFIVVFMFGMVQLFSLTRSVKSAED